MRNPTLKSRHVGSAQTVLRWVLVAMSLALGACYKATFVQPRTAAGIEHDEWNDFFLFGLAGEEDRDLSSYCGGAIARVRTAGNFATGLVSFVTLGIYTPRKLYVTCVDEEATKQLASLVEGGGTP